MGKTAAAKAAEVAPTITESGVTTVEEPFLGAEDPDTGVVGSVGDDDTQTEVDLEERPEVAAGLEGVMDAWHRSVMRLGAKWGDLSEWQQRGEIQYAEQAMRECVEALVEAVESRGLEYVAVDVEKVTFDAKGAKVGLVAGRRGRGIHAVADRAGETVIVVLSSVDEFTAGDLPKPQPQQPELDLPGGADRFKPGDVVIVGEDECTVTDTRACETDESGQQLLVEGETEGEDGPEPWSAWVEGSMATRPEPPATDEAPE